MTVVQRFAFSPFFFLRTAPGIVNFFFFNKFTGSHTVLSLLDHGYRVTIIDNLDNSFEEAYRRMQELAGDKAANMKFIKVRRTSLHMFPE
jgi:hypothetical protein